MKWRENGNSIQYKVLTTCTLLCLFCFLLPPTFFFPVNNLVLLLCNKKAEVCLPLPCVYDGSSLILYSFSHPNIYPVLWNVFHLRLKLYAYWILLTEVIICAFCKFSSRIKKQSTSDVHLCSNLTISWNSVKWPQWLII